MRYRLDAILLTPTIDACIETQAKRRYNAAASSLLQNPYDQPLREQLEALRLFLEREDFRQLRAQSEPHLIAGRKVIFRVWQEESRVRWRMDVTG